MLRSLQPRDSAGRAVGGRASVSRFNEISITQQTAINTNLDAKHVISRKLYAYFTRNFKMGMVDIQISVAGLDDKKFKMKMKNIMQFAKWKLKTLSS